MTDAQSGEINDSRPSAPLSESRGFAITAALLVTLGGFIVPIIGWIAGIVMVWMSRLWTRAEKLIATLAPLAVAAIVTVITLIVDASQPEKSATGGGFMHPLGLGVFNLGHPGILLALASASLAGIWLLWRLRARRASTTSAR